MSKPEKWTKEERIAYRKGRRHGLNKSMAMILWVLVDKHNAQPKDIKKLTEELLYLADSISKRYVSLEDIIDTLRDEYGWEEIPE